MIPRFTFLVLCCLLFPSEHLLASEECVVLLHGLARSSNSMDPMEEYLGLNGYGVVNLGYPSREHPVEVLAEDFVGRGFELCRDREAEIIHVVTHSLGGILVRQFLSNQDVEELGYVVMLAPPNQGSEVVDDWREVPGYELVNGPAGMQLGTDETSTPLGLGPVDFPLGVIAGTRSVNPILSLSLPNPDDGKVSVESTKVEGMLDHIEVPHSHTFLMRADSVKAQVLHFLKNGEFLDDAI